MYEGLIGKTVVLTREPEDNAEVAARIRDRVARIVELPCVRTEPNEDTSVLAEAMTMLNEEDWVVVTSRHGADAIGRVGPTRAAVAAIGEATVDRLRVQGFGVAFRPSAPSGAALGRELPFRAGVVLLARSDRALPDLPEILRERGFTVREVVAYHTVAVAQGDVAVVRALLTSSPEAAVVMFYSPSAVAGMLGAIEAPLLARASIQVAGRATMRAVREALGVDVGVSLIEEEATHVAHR